MNKQRERVSLSSVIVSDTIDLAIRRQSMPDANFGDWIKPEQLADLLVYSTDPTSVIRELSVKAYSNA